MVNLRSILPLGTGPGTGNDAGRGRGGGRSATTHHPAAVISPSNRSFDPPGRLSAPAIPLRVDPSEYLRKRLLDQIRRVPTRPKTGMFDDTTSERASASPPKARFRTTGGTPLASTGAPSPDGLDWTIDRPNNPFATDRLPFDPKGLFDADAGLTPSPESARLAALRAYVRPTIAKLSSVQRDAYIATLPSPIQIVMNQPYGKPDTNHRFTNDKVLRHVMYPLFCSGFLDEDSHMRLLAADPSALSLHHLIRDYSDIDFTPLRTDFLQDEWAAADDLDHDRGKMLTACLLHYNGDMATTFRYVGGPCTMEHTDIPKILSDLAPIVTPETLSEVHRIYTEGAPTVLQAESTDANLRNAAAYGNHPSLAVEPEKTRKAMVKDAGPGWISFFDRRMLLFTLNAHVSPLGITDLNHPYKNPRIFYDASFRPSDYGFTVNDWVKLENEPELIFGIAFMVAVTWIWRLRACYPATEIVLSDNDVASCFRRIGHHPDCASVMLFVWGIYLYVYTRLSFGGNYCPPNWESLAIARMQVALHLYQQHDTIAKAAPHLPPITFAGPPTADEIAAFTPANLDEVNTSVFARDGSRLPPPMPMHVDDALCAEVVDRFLLMMSASVLSLYMVLGFPNPAREPDPLSRKKWVALSTHERKYCGVDVNSRTLMLSMVPHKRDQLISELNGWLLPSATFTLLDFARLTGVLVDHARICRWARCYVYNIVNQLGQILNARYRMLIRGKSKNFAAQFGPVPKNMEHRLDQLVSRAKAQILWQHRSRYSIGTAVLNDLRFLHTYLSDRTNPWSMSIGHFIKRTPIGCSYGDASTGRGMGFYSHTHKFYSFMFWSPELRHKIHLKNPSEACHINQLEMVTYLLQLAAIATAIADPSQMPPDVAEQLRDCPTAPRWSIYVDNMATKFWGEKGMATTARGQLLLRVQAALYYKSDVQGMTTYIRSEDNTLADLLSRSPEPPLTHDSYSAFVAQVFLFDNRLRSYTFFHPSPILVSLLRSILLTNASYGIDCLPAALGHFERDVPATYNGVML
jgi:hypothetical protein